MNDFEKQKQNTREILHLAADRIKTGKDKYCCIAIDRAAEQLNFRSSGCHTRAHNALYLFRPLHSEVSVFLRSSGNFFRGTAHGWFGYPGYSKNQGRRVVALLLAMETV